MIWLTSDTHFWHKNIIELGKRPYADLDEMHEALIKNWNDRVRPEDTIYVLGDMNFGSFKDFEPIAKRLNGIKVLIRGNHDKLSDGQYRKLGFTVYHELTMKIAGQMCRFSHYPYAPPWYKRLFMGKHKLRYLERRPARIKGEILIHGHSHSPNKVYENSIHVGCEAWSCRPVKINEIESLINKINNNK